MNYERFEPSAAMIADCDEITLGDLRSRADTLDRLFIEGFIAELGSDGIDSVSAECDERILNTLKAFSDRYEGQSVALLLSGLLHLALTSVYTVEYQFNNMMLEHEIDEIMGGSDDGQA